MTRRFPIPPKWRDARPSLAWKAVVALGDFFGFTAFPSLLYARRVRPVAWAVRKRPTTRIHYPDDGRIVAPPRPTQPPFPPGCKERYETPLGVGPFEAVGQR